MPHIQKGRFWHPIASASTRSPHLALQHPLPTGHILGIMACLLDNQNMKFSGNSICFLSTMGSCAKRRQPLVRGNKSWGFIHLRADSAALKSGSGDGNTFWCNQKQDNYIQEYHRALVGTWGCKAFKEDLGADEEARVRRVRGLADCPTVRM